MPACSRSASVGVPIADVRPSASRVVGGRPASRTRTSPSRVGGTGSGSSGSTSRCSARAISRAKNGFPPERSWIRSSVWRAKVLPSRSRSSRWTAPTLSGSTWTRSGGTADSSSDSSTPSSSRLASRSRTLLSSSRLSPKARAAADEGSSHWTSSTPTTTGSRSLSAARTSRTATESALWSTGSSGDSSSSSATSRARRRGGARPARTSSRTPSNRSPSPACGRPRSASEGRVVRTRRPCAAAYSTPASQSVDFPMPGSPSSTSAVAPASSRSTNARTAASSSSLPTISGPVISLGCSVARNLDHDLAELSALCEATEGRVHLGEREDRVDLGLELTGLGEPAELEQFGPVRLDDEVSDAVGLLRDRDDSRCGADCRGETVPADRVEAGVAGLVLPGPPRPGELSGEMPRSTVRSEHADALVLAEGAVVEEPLPRGQAGERERRALDVAQAPRFAGQHRGRDDCVLGGDAVAVERCEREDFFAVGDARQLVRGDRGQAVEGPGQLVACDCCGVDAYERFACIRLRNRDLLDPEAVLVQPCGAHHLHPDVPLPGRGRPRAALVAAPGSRHRCRAMKRRAYPALDVVGGRGRLPDLPAIVPGLGRRRDRRLARDRAAPRPPRLSRRGRFLAFTHLPLTARRLRLRHLRLHRDRSGLRDDGRLRPTRAGGPRPRAEGAARPSALAHVDRAPVVPRPPRLVLVVPRRRPAEQLESSVRRRGVEPRRGERPLVPAHVLRGAAGPRLA